MPIPMDPNQMQAFARYNAAQLPLQRPELLVGMPQPPMLPQTGPTPPPPLPQYMPQQQTPQMPAPPAPPAPPETVRPYAPAPQQPMGFPMPPQTPPTYIPDMHVFHRPELDDMAQRGIQKTAETTGDQGQMDYHEGYFVLPGGNILDLQQPRDFAQFQDYMAGLDLMRRPSAKEMAPEERKKIAKQRQEQKKRE